MREGETYLTSKEAAQRAQCSQTNMIRVAKQGKLGEILYMDGHILMPFDAILNYKCRTYPQRIAIPRVTLLPGDLSDYIPARQVGNYSWVNYLHRQGVNVVRLSDGFDGLFVERYSLLKHLHSLPQDEKLFKLKEAAETAGCVPFLLEFGIKQGRLRAIDINRFRVRKYTPTNNTEFIIPESWLHEYVTSISEEEMSLEWAMSGEAQELLHIGRERVRQLIGEGKLEAIRIGRNYVISRQSIRNRMNKSHN